MSHVRWANGLGSLLGWQLSPRIQAHSEPVNMTLFGSKVFADNIQDEVTLYKGGPYSNAWCPYKKWALGYRGIESGWEVGRCLVDRGKGLQWCFYNTKMQGICLQLCRKLAERHIDSPSETLWKVHPHTFLRLQPRTKAGVKRHCLKATQWSGTSLLYPSEAIRWIAQM